MNSEGNIQQEKGSAATLISGTAAVMLGLFASVVLQFSITIVLSYTVGNDGIGFISLTTRTTTLFTTLILLGLPPMVATLVSSENDYETRVSILVSAITMTLPLGILTCFLIIYFSAPLSTALGSASLQLFLILQAPTIPISVLGVTCANYLRGNFKFRYYSISMVVAPLTNFIIILLYINALTVVLAIMASVISTIIGTVTTIFLLFPLKPKMPTSINIKKLVIPSFPLLLVGFCGTLIDSIDAIVLAMIEHDMGLVGVYSNMYILSSYLRYLVEPLSLVLLPIISSTLTRPSTQSAYLVINASMRLILIVFTPIAIIYAILSNEIVEILLPPSFLSGASILSLLSLAIPLLALYYLSSRILIAVKKTYLLGGVLLMCSLSDVLLTLLLTDYAGVLGTAISTIITFTLLGIVTTYYAAKSAQIKLQFYKRDFIFIALVLASCTITHIISIELMSVYYPLGSIVLVILVGILVATLIKPVRKEELDLLLVSLKSIPIIGSRINSIERILLLFVH